MQRETGTAEALAAGRGEGGVERGSEGGDGCCNDEEGGAFPVRSLQERLTRPSDRIPGYRRQTWTSAGFLVMRSWD